MKSIVQIQNLHLTISTLIVLPIALVYGFFPEQLLSNPLDTFSVTTNVASILKALMGLYIATALLWIIGIYNPKMWPAATISNALFMLGLSLGRAISCVCDGIPSPLFASGMVGEFILGLYGIYQYYKKTT